MSSPSAIDPRIERLKLTTFFGKRLTRRQLAEVQEMVASLPGLSRNELGKTVCEQLGWKTKRGRSRVRLALRVLEELQRLGVLSLPEKRRLRRGRDKPVKVTARSAPRPLIETDLDSLRPLQVQLARTEQEVAQWREWVQRYHPRGCRKPLGPHLRYVLRDRQGRLLGCAQFENASRQLACRDAWIGWQGAAFQRQLKRVVRQSRYLLMPWVRVPNLASHALAALLRQLPADWQRERGCRPVLVETFVDLEQHRGTCYKAAGWQYLGLTKGRKAQGARPAATPKAVYACPLREDFRELLLRGRPAAKPRAAARPRSRPQPPGPQQARREERFAALWRDVIADVVRVATAYDREWMRRRRKVNTLLVVLFVFRLVFAPNRQGYAATLQQVWEQCRQLELPLPGVRPVAASSICNARAKVRDQAFRDIHHAILARAPADTPRWLWRGHPVFAVDGSKLNLPRPLLHNGYRTPSPSSHYPQGLLSCLYQLRARLPIDVDLSSHANERAAALTHLPALRPGAVVVYDCGYYSFLMLHDHVLRGLHTVFRVQSNASALVADFVQSQRTDELVTVWPSDEARSQQPQAALRPVRARLVKYTAGGTEYYLMTTLLHRQHYPVPALSDLYHARWGIEELYKVVKRLVGLEPFHAQSERGVRQELWAACSLIAMARLFTNHAEQDFRSEAGKPPLQANFRNSLRTVGQHLEGLLLQYSATLGDTVHTILDSIAHCRQRQRPHRSYPRVSRRSDDRFRPRKKNMSATPA